MAINAPPIPIALAPEPTGLGEEAIPTCWKRIAASSLLPTRNNDMIRKKEIKKLDLFKPNLLIIPAEPIKIMKLIIPLVRIVVDSTSQAKPTMGYSTVLTGGFSQG
jgi:hypothetical protein